MFTELRHELRSWRDTIAIKGRLLWHFQSLLGSLFSCLFGIVGCTKSSRSLLIHLSSRCYPVNSHEEKFLRLDLSKQMLDVVEDCNEHFVFRHAEGNRI